MVLSIAKTVSVHAKTMIISISVCDKFWCEIKDQYNETIGAYKGFTPRFMPGNHIDKDLYLEIDIMTGVIKNWNIPCSNEIEGLLKTKNDF